MMYFEGRDLYGCNVQHGNESVGVVRDLLFDRHTWIVRYLVVETGAWPSPRRILLQLDMVESYERSASTVQISLTQAELSDCPLESLHPSASQQYIRRLTGPPSLLPHWADDRQAATQAEDDPFLESSQQINGYRLVGSSNRNERIIDLRFQTADDRFCPTVAAILTRSFWSRRRNEVAIAHVTDMRHRDQRVVVARV